MKAKRTRTIHPPANNAPEIFASDFEVHDWDDWLRIDCLVATVEAAGDGPGRRERRAAILLPRSSLLGLAELLRISGGYAPRGGHHS